MIENVAPGGKKDSRLGDRAIVIAEMVAQVQRMVEESGNPEGFDAKTWLDDWLRAPCQRWYCGPFRRRRLLALRRRRMRAAPTPTVMQIRRTDQPYGEET